MAEGQIKQMLENEVTCPLCLDLFKDPKKLPCDHVYCKDCLRGLAVRSLNATISCPECRTLTQVPGNDVNNFPAAFRINRFIEAFQQVRVETDSPNATEMCAAHPAQPLAIFCETCKKQLCRDCVLMSKEHTSHKYGFFKEVAPKYREKVISKLSLIKMQKSSISSALGEIAAAEGSVSGHSQKCQDNLEQAFEELISVLQTCKQAMKDEATAYYSSLTGVFDQQKERLKDIESKVESIVTSVDTTLQDDDQSFLVRLKSTFERMSNLQKDFETVPLTVVKPQLVATQVVSAYSLQEYMRVNCCLYNIADAQMCLIDTSLLLNTKLQVGQQITFTLTLCDSKANVCGGETSINVNLVDLQQGKLTKGNIEPLTQGRAKITLSPERRGKHQLNVKVNGAHIKNSPFTVIIYMPPDCFSLPVATISGLRRPCSLLCVQDKVLATEVQDQRITEIDSKLQTREFMQLSGAYELTQDPDLNIYVTTGNHHKLIKLSNTGNMIKTIGERGKRNAEFNFPNGLRVNKKRELYVCDSRNGRVQVFDLDLNFKRSFGKCGRGKGQFIFPADVDFDSSGSIYVTDFPSNHIQIFTSTEHHIRSIGNNILGFEPVSLLMHNENIYVTDFYNHCVYVINTSGEVIATFGNGYLRNPEGITMDKDGFVYVTSDQSKIVVF